MRSTKFKKNLIAAFLTLLLVSVALSLSYSRVLDVYELPTLDLRYKLRPKVQIDDKIVIIEISDDSIRKIGSWPFDRKYHALLVKALSYGGAKQIIFDVFFSEAKKGDDDFARAVKEAGNVYMPYVFDITEKEDAPIPIAAGYEARLLAKLASACKGTGHINIIPDIDGKFRRIPPFIKWHNRLYPHIGFLAAANFLGFSRDSIKMVQQRFISLNKKIKIPLDLNSNIIINFPGRWVDTYRHYSYIDVLTSYVAGLEGKKGVLDLEELKDSICFIGITATAAPDIHPSPFESLYPGVGIHASLFNSMIFKKFISRVSRVSNLLILIILGIITFVTTIKSRKLLSFLYLFGMLFSFFLVGVVLFAVFGLWIDIFYPIIASTMLYLGLTFRKYIVEMHKREVIENELSIAKDIQQSFLPKAKPGIEGVAIEAKMLTAHQVGGDLYDFIDISRKKAGVMIGDVSGKGVPAALYMAKVVSEFKSYAKEGLASNAVLKLNDRLVQESGSNLFVTLSYLIFDMEKRTLNFSIGGHLPTLMFREGEEEPRYLDLKEGMPLGLMESSFSDDTIEIKKGDLFILYTDGVTEAMNKRRKMFGTEKLADIVRTNRTRPLRDIVDLIHKEVRIYEGRLPQHDDITVVAIRVDQ